MPGKKITDHQVKKYNQHRNKHSQVAAAAKAGISERSAIDFQINSFQVGSSNILILKTFLHQNGSYSSESL